MATAQQYAQWIVAHQDQKGTPDFETVARAYKQAKAMPAPAAPSAPEQPSGFDLGRRLAGVADAGAAGLSGALVGGVGGGLASLGAKWTGQDPAAARKWVDENMVHHAQTPEGQAITGAVGNMVGRVAAPVKSAMNTVDTTVDGSLTTPYRNALRVAGNVAGAVNSDIMDIAGVAPAAGIATQAVRSGKAALAASEGIPKAFANKVEELRSFGMKLRPSDAAMSPGSKPSIGGRMLESSVDSGVAGQELSKFNEKVFQEKSARPIGADLSKTNGLYTPKIFKELKDPHNQVYGEMAALPEIPTTSDYRAALGRIDAKGKTTDTENYVAKLQKDYGTLGSSDQAVNDVRALRADASKWKQSEDPDANAKGFAAQKVANAIDDELARRAAAVGNTTLVERFTASRQALAKIHTVEDATRAGIVDAKKLFTAREHGDPINLTPEFQFIADAAEYAPGVSRHRTSFLKESAENVPHGFGGLAQAVIRNVGGRQVLMGPYQRALGKAVERKPNPELSIPKREPLKRGVALIPGQDYTPQIPPRGPSRPHGAEGPLQQDMSIPIPRYGSGMDKGPGIPYNYKGAGSGNNALSAADERMAAALSHPGTARITPKQLMLPAPGQSSHRGVTEALSNQARLQHKARPNNPLSSTVTEAEKKAMRDHVIQVLAARKRAGTLRENK